MNRIKHNGMFYRVVPANSKTESPCKMCHFHDIEMENDSPEECPRMPRISQTRAGPLVCIHYDTFDVGETAYLVRDTKQGRAEWIARKLEQ